MNTLYIERSTGDSRNGTWVRKLDLTPRPDRIIIGTGPGSFAGIRSALAFAQGYAIGAKNCEVLGLPSACALTEEGKNIAVVGDARRGKFWIALFSSFNLVKDIFQVDGVENLSRSIPEDYQVVTPDAERIDELLRGTFGPRYLGGRLPTVEGLERFVTANPSILKPEPLPIYLNPAVRD